CSCAATAGGCSRSHGARLISPSRCRARRRSVTRGRPCSSRRPLSVPSHASSCSVLPVTTPPARREGGGD
ncbi:MAG: hypothetical protein AVDCRST_MAG88-3856, partial [uncultured Thermomicrobiales bacterium]